MSAVTKQEIVSLIEGLIESDACMGSISDKQVVTALEVVSRIKANGIAPSDNVKQADEETHRRVDEAVRNGRIEDRRAALTKKYVPMTDVEWDEISKKWQSDSVECMKNGQSIPPFHLYIEAEVIRRAGLEVSE